MFKDVGDIAIVGHGDVPLLTQGYTEDIGVLKIKPNCTIRMDDRDGKGILKSLDRWRCHG
jgi:hypothetical protein